MGDIFYMVLGVGLFAAMVLYAFISPRLEAHDSLPASQKQKATI